MVLIQKKIMVGHHSIRGNNDTYGHLDVSRFDGIHMYGPQGTSEYTEIVFNIISSIVPVTKPQQPIPPKARQVKPAHPTINGQTFGRSVSLAQRHHAGLQKDRDRGTAGPKEGLSSIGRFG